MTGAVIGSLRVNLGLDSAQFQSGMKRAQADSEALGRVLKVGFAAAAAAAAAGLAAVGAAISANLGSFDDLSKTSQKIGVPVEELSKLKYAADLSGVSMEGMQTSVSKLSRAMVDASGGTGKMAETFKALGISVRDSAGNLKLPSGVLTELADKFAAMPDGAQKTALAMQLLGKSGADLIPMLNGGSSALNGLLEEAKGFGLEVSTESARMAEAVNDNFSRMGYAFSGLGVQMTAALAPALLTLSEVGVAIAKAVAEGLEYLPQLAEAVAVVGAGFTVAFAPALLASIKAATVAVGVGLVGAFRALGAAMIANPISLFVAAIGTAVYAVYKFRDEIESAIGVDVWGTVKDGGNFIINSFVAAFDAVSVAWSQLPAVLGDAVFSAANGVIAGVELMINKVITALNGFIQRANSLLPESWQKGMLDMVDLGRLENEYAGAAKATAEAVQQAVSEAFAVDRLSKVGEVVSKAFTPAIAATNQFAQGLSGVNKEMSELAGGGKGKSGPAGAIAIAKENLSGFASEMAQIGQSLAGMFSSAFSGLIDGSKKVKDVLKDLAKQLTSMLMNKGFQMIFSAIFPGGGGFAANTTFGNFLQGIPGFASGGTILPGGAGGIDSQLVMFRKSPNERVDITKPGQTLASGRGDVTVQIVNNTGAQVREERDNRDGEEIRRFIIGTVQDATASGDMDRSNRGRFGLSPQRVIR